MALSTVLVGLGATVFLGTLDGVIAVRIAAWMVVTGTAFAAVEFLVALHLAAMVGQFDGVPLIADLLTVGAVMGVLIGRYDGQNRQYQERIRAERNRFVSLFDNLPNPGFRYVFRDGDPVVADANEAFETVFGRDARGLRGTPAGHVGVLNGRAGDDTDLDDILGARTVLETEVRRWTATGLRDFRLYVVPYGDDEGFVIAVDVTERKQQIRRLEVLNRVLRHDLRTDANVIAGTADLLPESAEAETIRNRALEMAERGETARRVDRALDGRTTRRPVDLAAVLRDRVANIEDATVHTDLQPATVTATDPLGDAIDELLTNAIEHADSSTPTVWVTVRDGEQFATLDVADDGPGLPEMERQVLESGTETPLRHSIGLGLRLVRWIVEDLGGDVTARDRDGGGTVISLRLPSAVPEPGGGP